MALGGGKGQRSEDGGPRASPARASLGLVFLPMSLPVTRAGPGGVDTRQVGHGGRSAQAVTSRRVFRLLPSQNPPSLQVIKYLLVSVCELLRNVVFALGDSESELKRCRAAKEK